MTTPLDDMNLNWWEEVTPHHLQSRSYDLEGFLKGKNTLLSIERTVLGDVKGKRILHLQCHIGLDTLSWARMGANVTGVDFSPAAIRAAKDLARKTGLEKQASFIEADVLKWHRQAKPEFDWVISTWGILCWLSDLKPWALGIAASLKPGGKFFLADIHPMAETISFHEGWKGGIVADYFGKPQGNISEPAPDYASSHAVAGGNRQWVWPISKTVQNLLDAGLQLVRLEEYPYCIYEHVKGLVQGENGYWYFPPQSPQCPLLFSLLAKRI